MLLKFSYFIFQNFCASSIITESFYIIPGPDQYFYAPKRFIENHSELVYRRMFDLMTYITESIPNTDNPSLSHLKNLKWTILYKEKPLLLLYDLLLNFFDDRSTGDFYNCFSNEIEAFIMDFFENQQEKFSKDKLISEFTKMNFINILTEFKNQKCKGFYNDLLIKSRHEEKKLAEMIFALSQSQVIKNEVSFCESTRYNFEVIKLGTIQKAIMRFMLPLKNPQNGLRLETAVMNSIASILNFETKIVNLLIDFHAEQFIYEYLSITIEKKIEPDLIDCNKFLMEIYEDIKMILNTSNRNNKTGNFEGSRVNVCFVRMDEELAFYHLNFAMCHFLRKDDNAIREIYKNLNLIEEILPYYLYLIITGFRNDKIFFKIDLIIVAYQKFNENIQNDKILKYEEAELKCLGSKDYSYFVDLYGLLNASTTNFINPVLSFEKQNLKVTERKIPINDSKKILSDDSDENMMN